jgi:glutathione S-transferase
MFTLYSRPGTGSAAVEALFEELGVSYKIEDILRLADGSLPASLFEINPRGEIPCLRFPDDKIMTESAAILIYLADLFPAANLAPVPKAPQRSEYLRWMLYFASAVYMADLRFYYPARYSSDAAHAPAIKAKAVVDMDRDFKIFADELGDKPFILGQNFSAVDIYAAMLLSWAPDISVLFTRYPNLKNYYYSVATRPKIVDVWKRNGFPI